MSTHWLLCHNDGRYTVLVADDAERSTEFFFAGDTLTNLEVEVSSVTDSVEMGESVLISFVFFRNPTDSFEMQDSVSVERGVGAVETILFADAVDKFDIGVNPTDTLDIQDSTSLI